MKPQSVHNFQEWFEALHTTDKSQVAMMHLDSGAESAAEPESHPHSDQVMLVLEGTVEGDIQDEHVKLHKGEFITIPANTSHRFYNPSEDPVLTFNFYAPPAYPASTQG